MTADDPRIQPLLEWNRLARENAENAIVSSMLLTLLKAGGPIEMFVTWLLVGTAAIASFLLGNADKLIPIFGQSGFREAGGALFLSCLFGVLSKIFAVRLKVAINAVESVQRSFQEHLARYENEETKINDGARFWGISLETGIRADRVIEEFLKPLPFLMRWAAQRFFKKHAGNTQAAYISGMKSLSAQSRCAFLQALGFLTFLFLGFASATTVH